MLFDGKDREPEICVHTESIWQLYHRHPRYCFSGTIRDNITYGIENVSEEQLQEVVKAANLTDLMESPAKGT